VDSFKLLNYKPFVTYCHKPLRPFTIINGIIFSTWNSKWKGKIDDHVQDDQQGNSNIISDCSKYFLALLRDQFSNALNMTEENEYMSFNSKQVCQDKIDDAIQKAKGKKHYLNLLTQCNYLFL